MTPELIQLENEAEQLKKEGEFAAAIEKLNEALALDGNFVRAHLALSILHEKIQDYAKSVDHAEKAVEIEPADAFNMTALSVTYQRAFEGTRDPIYIQKAEEALARTRRGCS